MNSPYEKEIADEWGPANAVTPFQIRSMFRMAKLGTNDVYYDLGSGHGRTVRLAAKEFRVRMAIGIEHEPERFCHARMLAKKTLTKRQLDRVEFWLEEMDESDLVGAKVAFYGLEPHRHEDKLFRKLFKGRRVRIIRKDLPTVGYAPIGSSRDSRSTWFFLMSYPLTKYRIEDKDKWAKAVLGPKATTKDVFRYYDRQLKRRKIADRASMVRKLRRLVRESFPR